jgi:hypothetical protein
MGAFNTGLDRVNLHRPTTLPVREVAVTSPSRLVGHAVQVVAPEALL